MTNEAAYVPKKGDIVDIEGFNWSFEYIGNQLDDAQIYRILGGEGKVIATSADKITLRGLSLARIEAEYITREVIKKKINEREERIAWLNKKMEREPNKFFNEELNEINLRYIQIEAYKDLLHEKKGVE